MVDLTHGVSQLAVDLSPFQLDDGKLLLDLGSGPIWIAKQFEVAVLLGVQFLETSLELFAKGIHAAQLVEQRVVKLLTDRLTELVTEPDGGVVPFNLAFNVVHLEVGLMRRQSPWANVYSLGEKHARIRVNASSCRGNYEWNLDVQYVIPGGNSIEHRIVGPFQSFGVANNTTVYRGYQGSTGSISISETSTLTGNDPELTSESGEPFFQC